MLNPGFKVIWRKNKSDILSMLRVIGPPVKCPHCKTPVAEGDVMTILTRCKNCGNWVYAEKKVDNAEKK